MIVIGMVRALRKWLRHTGASHIPGLTPADMALLTGARVDAEPWYPYDQYLRLMAVSFELFCARDWTKLREYCSKGVAPVYELGYGPLLHDGDPQRTLAAASILWRACHSFGRAQAESDALGTTIHVIDYPDVDELDGNVNVGWFVGMARCAGAVVTEAKVVRAPWAEPCNEQVVRLEWHLPAKEPLPSESSLRLLRGSADLANNLAARMRLPKPAFG